MKMWIARTLGGAVCTISLVALGTGGAYAGPHPADGGIDLDVGGLVKVKVGGHTSSSNGGRSHDDHPSSSSNSSSSKRLLRVKVGTPNRVLPRVRVKVASPPHSATPSSSSTPTVRRAAEKKTHERKAAAERAAAKKVATKKVVAKKAATRAAARKAAATRVRISAVGQVRALSGVLPGTVVRADASVVSIPIRACVEVNADGCSRYRFSGTPATGSTTEHGGGGYKTVFPAALPAVVAKATAQLPVVGQANACVLVNAPGCSNGTGTGSAHGSGSGPGHGAATTLPVVVPPVLVLADANVLSVPVRACVEVNVSGCSTYVYSGAPAANPGSEHGGGGFAAALPSVLAEAGAAVPVVGGANACVLVNTLGCSTGTGTGSVPGAGTGTGTTPGGVLPVVIGTVGVQVPVVGRVDACVLVNAPGCSGGGSGGTDPGDPTTGSGGGDGHGGDPVGMTDVAANTAVVPADLGGLPGSGGDRSLARTGAAAGTVGALGAGLALLGAGAVLLRRRARAHRS